MADQQPVLNEAGTHTYVRNVESGDEWECPNDYLPVALTHGFELTEPRDRSLDGLFDESTAEPAGQQTGFNPAEHDVAEVNEHLAKHAESSPGEVERVLALEVAGKNRKTVVDPRLDGDDEQDPEGNPGE